MKKKLGQIISAFFLLLVVVLLVRHVKQFSWDQLWGSLQSYGLEDSLPIFAATVICYISFACYEIFAKKTVLHHLSYSKTAMLGLVVYPFNLNLGTIVGGIGLRLRYYQRYGVSASTAVAVTSVCLMTSWLGFLLVSGSLMLFSQDAVISIKAILVNMDHALFLDEISLKALSRWIIGFGLLVFFILIIMLTSPYWSSHFKRSKFANLMKTFKPRIILLQMLVSAIQWIGAASIIYICLRNFYPVHFGDVLLIYILSAVAGTLTHVPAGLGVIESVFLLRFSMVMLNEQIIAALLVFRFAYYIVPWALTMPVAIYVEIATRNRIALQQPLTSAG